MDYHQCLQIENMGVRISYKNTIILKLSKDHENERYALREYEKNVLISIRELFILVKSDKKIRVLGTNIFLTSTIFYILILPNLYN